MRAFLIVCLIAALLPLLPRPGAAPTQEPPFPGWPAAYDGPAWRELELDARERRFFGGFPGRTTRRTDGERTVLLRWVLEPTRRLHPAQECYRGLGFDLRALPLQVEHGATWSAFVATRGAARWLVRERIFDAQGGEWTDVSSWFWSGLTGRSRGPWFAVTLVEPLREP